MKPQATGIRKASTFDGQQIAMTIDTNSLSHIMSVLTNLYSDPEMAVLREYACNARDSHLASGNPDPIEIILPTPLSQNLVIRDRGLGLSIDDITAIYSRYGASTKRDTNEQTGMLGLGSKSALTYATQFTMTAVKDGVLSEVLISVKVDGAGTMTVMDTRATNERNGVTITIPTQPNNNLAEKANDLFAYWGEGTVLVNGEQPERKQGIVVGDALITDERMSYYGGGKHKVVMGGVPYPVDDDITRLISKSDIGNAVVFYVPMGAVDFVPSREELHFTPRTKEYLRKMVDDFIVRARANALAEIATATTKPEALTIASRWRRVGNFEGQQRAYNSPFQFRGESIPRAFQGAHFWYDPNSYGSRKTSRGSTLSADLLDECVFIHGYEAEGSPSATVRERVAQWQANNGHSARKYLCFAKSNFAGEWTNALSVDYDTIKSTKLPKASAGKSGDYTYVKSYDWDTVNPDGTLTPVNGSKIIGKVAYFSPTDLSKDYYRTEARSQLYAFLANYNYTLVEVAKNSQGRFTSEVSAVCEPLVDVMRFVANDRTKALSDRDLAIGEAKIPHKSLTSFCAYYGSELLDDTLRGEMSDASDCNDRTARNENVIRQAYKRTVWSAPSRREINYTVRTLDYPVLVSVASYGGRNTELDNDLVTYANAKWHKLTSLS